jgi:hypothetical protein
MDEDKYNISQYTDNELYSILDLNNPTDRELEAKLIHMINKYSNMQNESGYKLAVFFQNIYNHFFEPDEYDESDMHEIITEGFEDKLNIGDSENGVSKNLNISKDIQSTIGFNYTQDKFGLNPLLKQTIKRIITIDSQYRDNKKTSLSTDFTFNLSEMLRDVVSLTLTSVSIPITWYTISKSYGSNFLYLKGNADGIDNGFHDYKIQINAGNYKLNSSDNSNIINAVNNSLIDVSNTYSDVNFGKTSLFYNNSTGSSTFTIDIQKVYNESCFYLEFPYWTPSVNSTLNSSELNVYRTQSIPSFLGFNKSIYNPWTIQSNQSYVLTSVINNATNTYEVDSSNNSFDIIQYSGSDEYNANSSIIHKNIRITITDGTYYRIKLVNEINNQLANSIYLDSSSSIYQVDIMDASMANVNYSHYEMKIKLNRNTVKQVPNSKVAVLFPDESTLNRNTIWRKFASSTYLSALFFDNLINETNTVYSESNSIKSSFQVNPNTSIYFKCINPPNYASTNDFSMNDIVVNVPAGNYVIDDLTSQINNSFKNVNNSVIPPKPYIFNSSTSATEVNNEFYLNTDITNTFINSNYKISLDEPSVFDFMNISIPPDYHLSDISENTFYGTFNIQTSYALDVSYILTYSPYGDSGNKNDVPRKIYLPERQEYAYQTYSDLLFDVETAIRDHIITDVCNNEVQTPFATSSIVSSVLNNIVSLALTIDIHYVLTESNYMIYFNDPNSNGMNDITNLWYNLYIDPSYVLHDKKLPRDPNAESTQYSTITSNESIQTNKIVISNKNNKIKIVPYYESKGGSYSNSNNMNITIPDGQYTKYELINKINELFTSNPKLVGSKMSSYVKNSNEYIKLLVNVNIIYTSKDYRLVFYDPVDFVKCYIGAKSVRNTTWDSTLGWILGFRDYTEYTLTASNETVGDINNYYIDSIKGGYTYTDIVSSISKNQIVNTTISLTGDSATTLYIYSYYLIVLDDYIQNHLNDGLVTITSRETMLELPDYTNDSTNAICDPVNGSTNIISVTNTDGLSQKQIYAINQNKISRKNKVNSYSLGPNIQDVLGMIPITVNDANTGNLFVETGGVLQNQNRVYFGPVNINRMSIKLINDKGDVVDLNNSDWSLSLACEQLYRSESIVKT